MSIVSGTIGAVMGSEAQNRATYAQVAESQASRQMAMAMYSQQRADAMNMYNQQRADIQPYADYGRDALARMKNYEMSDAQAPNYDEVVTDKLGAYQESDQFKAQNELANKALQRQLQARGLNYSQTGANALGEQTQKLIASDYGNYKQDLANRYSGLTADYNNALAYNREGYNRLADALGMGARAVGIQGGYGSGAMNALTGAAQNAAGNFMQNTNSLNNAIGLGGQAQASMWSGLGNASANTFGTIAKIGDSAGWWGNSGSAAGSAAGSGAFDYVKF